jgi:peptide/nickel transport system substrate-binding protein
VKKKSYILALAFVLIAPLVFAGGEKEEETLATAPGEPQYGGTFTYTYWSITKADPPSPDIQDELYISTRWLSPVQEMPLIADFEKYGPRGTGESQFSMAGYIPDKFQKGHLLESWEVTPEKITWHVRPGIYWAADNVDWMENRELTAQDMVDDILYFKGAESKGKFLRDLTGEIYATDKYTLVIETPGGFDITLMYKLGYEDRALISPPEMVVAGADKWENQVGTGPFMFKEYVVGSHMTFERNPNYWDTTIINGKEYEIPFFDEWVQPIIPDASTLVAALRTGKIDYDWSVDARHWETLDTTAPELETLKSPGNSGFLIFLKVDEPPFDNIDIRRALMIGTDIKAFGDLLGIGPVPILFYPTLPGTGGVFTPVKDLPASSRELFDYNPTLAKQMIADVYPDGLEIDYYAESEAFALDQASLLKFQWEKIGVDVTIKSFDTVTHDKHLYDRTYRHVLGARHGSADPKHTLEWSVTGDARNWAGYSNEWFDKQMALVKSEPDADERNRILKEMTLHIISQVTTIGLSPTPEANYWWPWVKNYYGEACVLDKAIAPVLARAWLDQDLKAEMGY